VSSFLRGPCTKNYCNRFIFDRFIPKIKRVTFLGHSVFLARVLLAYSPSINMFIAIGASLYQSWRFSLGRTLRSRSWTWSWKITSSTVVDLPKPYNASFLPRDAMHKRGLCQHAVSVRLSVRPSVTFVDHVKTNKHIFEIFSPSGSHTILVFLYQRGCRYSDGNPPNGVWKKSRFSTNISL